MSAKSRFVQRVVGALFLVAVAVIFLPMLLNKRSYPLFIPDQPEMDSTLMEVRERFNN